MSEGAGGRSLKAAVWATGVQGVDLVCQIGASVIVARMLGPTALGQLTLAFAVVAIVGLFLLFGTHAPLVQAYTRGVVPGAALLGASLTVLRKGAVLCLLMCVGAAFALQLDTDAVIALGLAYLAMLGNGLAQIVGIPLLGRDASARDLPCMLFGRIVLVAGVAVGAIMNSLPLAICGYIAGALALGAARAYVVHTHLFPLRATFDPKIFAQIKAQSRSIGLANIGAEISARADVLMLEAMTTTAQVGFYGAAYRIVNGIYAGTAALGTALFPGLVQALATRTLTPAARLFAAIPVVILVGCTIVAFTLAGPLIAVLYGATFAPSAELLTLLLLAAGLMAIAYFFSNYLVATSRQAILPVGETASAVLNISLNLWLIPIHGAWGAAVATLATQFLKLGIFSTALRRPAVVPDDLAP